MTSTTDKCNADSSDQVQPGSAALPRTGCHRLIIVCIIVGILVNAGWILGAYELLGPKVTYFALLTILGMAVVWPVAMLLAIRGSTRMICWIGILVASIPWFGGALIVLFLLVVGFFSTCGYCGPTAAPDPITWSLLSALVLAVAWILAILLVTRRRVSLLNRLAYVFGTVVCWGGPLLATMIFVLIPTEKINPVDFDDEDKMLWCMKPENAAKVRSICHRVLVWDSDPHDVFINLDHWGDKSSVPYLLWSLRWMPSEKNRMCTWAHGLDALRIITNHDAGETRQAWAEWYAANKGSSQAEWWADGFTDEGYPVSAEGGEASIRNLLAVFGRIPWCQTDDKPWLSYNARRMLDLLDNNDISRVIDSVIVKGSVQERCGAARYAYKFDRDYAEAMLRGLLKDEQRAVCLHASGALCHLQLEWLKNPSGYIEKRLLASEMSEESFFSPPGAKVVVPNKGIQINSRSQAMGGGMFFSSSGSGVAPIDSNSPDQAYPHVRIKAVPGSRTKPDRLESIICVDWPDGSPDCPASDDLAVIGIEGISSATGKTVYSKDIMRALDADELLWLYDPKSGGIYISVPNYTCKIDPTTGRILWEMGFGTGYHGLLYVIDGYLVICCNGDFIICDADRGGILANYDHDPLFFDAPLTMVDDRLRVKDFDYNFYILTLPEKE